MYIRVLTVRCFGINQRRMFLKLETVLYINWICPAFFLRNSTCSLNMDAQNELVKEERLSWKPIIFTHRIHGTLGLVYLPTFTIKLNHLQTFKPSSLKRKDLKTAGGVQDMFRCLVNWWCGNHSGKPRNDEKRFIEKYYSWYLIRMYLPQMTVVLIGV